MAGGAAGGLWRHQTWPPSWILSRIKNKVKTVRINNFLRLTCKITQITLHYHHHYSSISFLPSSPPPPLLPPPSTRFCFFSSSTTTITETTFFYREPQLMKRTQFLNPFAVQSKAYSPWGPASPLFPFSPLDPSPLLSRPIGGNSCSQSGVMKAILLLSAAMISLAYILTFLTP